MDYKAASWAFARGSGEIQETGTPTLRKG